MVEPGVGQAKADWKAGRMALPPDDDREFIPLPDELPPSAETEHPNLMATSGGGCLPANTVAWRQRGKSKRDDGSIGNTSRSMTK